MGIDLKEFLNLSDTANMVNGIFLYILAGVAALLLILLIVWLLFKISGLFHKKKGESMTKEEPTDEEQLFGD